MTNQQIKPLIPACLSNGWGYFELGALCDIERGITFPASEKTSKNSENSIACLRTANVQKEVDWDDLIYVPLYYVKKEEKLLRPGDILISMANSLELVGKVAFVQTLREQSTFGGFISAIRANAKIIPSYLFYFLKQASVQEEIRSTASRSVNIANLSLSKISQIKILVPPLDEQRRIVANLESILTQTRIARASLEGVPEFLKAFRQSVLAAAFRGELTERDPNDEPASVLLERIRAERRRRWEESLRAKGKDAARAVYEEPLAPDTSKLPELPEGWVWTTLDSLLERIEAGHSFKAQGRPAKEGEFGVIKVSAMTWGKFLPNENKALLPDTDPGNTPKVCKDDLLISRANTVELVGAVVLVEEDYPRLFLSDKSLRLVPNTEEVSKEFLLYALRTRQVRDVFEGEATGVSESMRNISQDKIRIAPIALPPLHEQAIIIEKIKQANMLSELIALAIETASCRLYELEQSALTKAFQGDL